MTILPDRRNKVSDNVTSVLFNFDRRIRIVQLDES